MSSKNCRPSCLGLIVLTNEVYQWFGHIRSDHDKLQWKIFTLPCLNSTAVELISCRNQRMDEWFHSAYLCQRNYLYLALCFEQQCSMISRITYHPIRVDPVNLHGPTKSRDLFIRISQSLWNLLRVLETVALQMKQPYHFKSLRTGNAVYRRRWICVFISSYNGPVCVCCRVITWTTNKTLYQMKHLAQI